MNWQQFAVLSWARWRVGYHQLRRQGVFSLIVTLVILGIMLAGGVIGFFVALTAGALGLSKASPNVVMAIVDGWLVVYLMFSMFSLLTEMQQENLLSADKLLHLPTSLFEVFLFNFLATLLSFTNLTLGPPILGFFLALVLVHGPSLLVGLPLLATWILLAAAIITLLRGWLASLMATPRGRRTTTVVISLIVMVVFMLPQSAIFYFSRNQQQHHNHRTTELQDLLKQHERQEITNEEFNARFQAIQNRDAMPRDRWAAVMTIVERVNFWFPPGWLALGTRDAIEGKVWPALGASTLFGLLSIGCLRISHRRMHRLVTQGVSDRPWPNGRKTVRRETLPRRNALERQLPWASPAVSAVFWASFQSMLRAPEVKMLMVIPIIMLLMFAGGISRGGDKIPPAAVSAMVVGVLAFSVLSIGQFAQNLFGIDRAGFRAYVLSGVPREQILIGRNLSLGPILTVVVVPVLVAIRLLAPLPWSHLAMGFVGIPLLLLVVSMIGNLLSVLVPFGFKPGTLQPASPFGLVFLVQMIFLWVVMLLVGLLIGGPLALDMIARETGWLPPAIPLGLILTSLELALVIVLYAVFIRRQGEMLQHRETKILATIAERGD